MPSSWILPGREYDPVMRYKAILETSFAHSRTFNPRNIEYHWYSLLDQRVSLMSDNRIWESDTSDLVADIPNLIVAPQFPIWFVPEHDEHEDEDDGDDPEMIVELKVEQSQEEGGDGAGNTSMASTVPERDAKSVIVDFVILHLKAVAQRPQPQSDPEWRIRYGGWRITTANIGLLVEVKRFASRSLEGQEQYDHIIARITEASDDLIEQAAHLSTHHEVDQ